MENGIRILTPYGLMYIYIKHIFNIVLDYWTKRTYCIDSLIDTEFQFLRSPFSYYLILIIMIMMSRAFHLRRLASFGVHFSYIRDSRNVCYSTVISLQWSINQREIFLLYFLEWYSFLLLIFAGDGWVHLSSFLKQSKRQ